MRKLIFMMAMLFTLSMSAQHVEESKLFDNMYTSVSVGAINKTNDFDFDYTRPRFSVEIGKQVTTYYTSAFEYDVRVNTNGAKTMFDEMSLVWLHKFNVINIVDEYRPHRKWDTYVVAGLGWGHEMLYKDDYGVFNTGLEFDYNMNDRWALKINPSIRWTHTEYGFDVRNSDFGIQLGFIYKFKNMDGSQGFKVCKYDKLLAKNERLNDEINRLRAELDGNKNTIVGYSNRIKELEGIKPDTIYIDNTVAPILGFEVNKYKVTKQDYAYLNQVAKQYKDSKLLIVGYADKATGTPQYNKELSMKRAQAVKDALVELGLDEKNIELKAMGDTEQPFDENDYNRVVIIKQ